jgi:hypothetical protein
MQTEDLEEYEEFNEYEVEEESESAPIIREDKIFNNRYNTGDGLTDSDDYQFSRQISVSSDYSDSYLRDLYEYEDGLENKFILDEIFKFVYSDEELSKIIVDPSELTQAKIKLTKEQVNFIFNKINEIFEKRTYQTAFYNPIYILEVISSISSIEYKKLFDMLDSDIQEILILELNKKYLFLEGRMQKKRIH